MHAVGITSLRQTDQALASQALAVYHSTAKAALLEAGGYVVQAADGLVLAAFTGPLRAIRWALDTVAACLVADWCVLFRRWGFLCMIARAVGARVLGLSTYRMPHTTQTWM